MGSRRIACFLSSRGAHYLSSLSYPDTSPPPPHTPKGTVCMGGLSPPALQSSVALWMGVTLAGPSGTKQFLVEAPSFGGGFPEGHDLSRGHQDLVGRRACGSPIMDILSSGGLRWGLGSEVIKSEHLRMPGSGKDAVVSPIIPGTNGTGSKLGLCPELTCPPLLISATL